MLPLALGTSPPNRGAEEHSSDGTLKPHRRETAREGQGAGRTVHPVLSCTGSDVPSTGRPVGIQSSGFMARSTVQTGRGGRGEALGGEGGASRGQQGETSNKAAERPTASTRRDSAVGRSHAALGWPWRALARWQGGQRRAAGRLNRLLDASLSVRRPCDPRPARALWPQWHLAAGRARRAHAGRGQWEAVSQLNDGSKSAENSGHVLTFASHRELSNCPRKSQSAAL